MSGLSFLLIALVLSVIGSVAIWIRHRPPTSLDHGIDEFRKEMRALAPDPRAPRASGPPAAGE